jgi:hypothetical protein
MSLFRDEKIADPQLFVDNASLLSASATAGTTQAVPATVKGYIIVTINGVQQKIPYFNV